VEYGEGPKYRAKVVSDECDGNLVVEGRCRNRTLHNDKVFFQLRGEEKDRIYCKIVHILSEPRQVVGRIDLIPSKGLYVLTPINIRICAINVVPESITEEMKKCLESHYFRTEYLGWDAQREFPECRAIEVFGKFGEIETETAALLRTNGVADEEHDEEKVNRDLLKFTSRMNAKGEYEIPEE
jgi:exoribonuclease R